MKQIPKIAGLGLVGVIAQQCMLPALALTQQPLDLDHSECKAMFMGRRNSLAKPPNDVLELVRSMGKSARVIVGEDKTCIVTGSINPTYKGFSTKVGGSFKAKVTSQPFNVFNPFNQNVTVTISSN